MRNHVIHEIPLKPDDISPVVALFEEKGWPIQDDTESNKNVFEEFCTMLTYLNEEEREVILELTKHFQWIRNSQYIALFKKMFCEFCSSYDFNRVSHLIICPLLREKDFFKNKSSLLLMYLIKADVYDLQDYCKAHKVPPLTLIEHPKIAREKYDEIVGTIKTHKRPLFCLVDDFIGSGQTAIEAVDYFITEGFHPSNFVILSLVAMKEGITHIRENGYSVFTCYEEKKGISGREQEHEWTEIMLNIEKRMKFKPEFEFGFAHSEALVRMIRTPNNTFPIYWCKTKVNPHPPFLR